MELKFDYDDILIQPATVTHIDSRSEINIYDENNMLPIFAAPMIDVVDKDNIDVFFQNKIYGIYPRTNWNDKYFFNGSGLKFSAHSLDEFDYWFLKNTMKTPQASVLIDIANGHMSKLISAIRQAKKKYGSSMTLMVGNIAHPETYRILSDNGADMIRVGIGNGCFAKGSRVLMSNGIYKNIEDVNVGDRVITLNGTSANVKRVIPNGIKKVIDLKTSMSPKITTVTPDHNYYVGKYKNNMNDVGYKKSIYQYQWNEINKFNDDFTPLFPNNINFELNDTFKIDLKDYSILKKTSEKYKTVLKPNYNLGYIFGTFLGDGNAKLRKYKRISKTSGNLINTSSGCVSWSFNKHENVICDKLIKSIKEEFGLIAKTKNIKNTIQVTLYCKPFAHFLDTFGKRQDKHLPQNLLINEPNYLNGLYDGLIDSDGNMSDGRVSFYNTSLKLVELYNIVYFMLNGTLPNSVIRINNTSKLVKNSNVGYFSRNLNRPECRKTKDDKYIINKVINITDNNQEVEVFDLEIDDYTHSFIVDNCVVHNSGCLTTENSSIGYPMASLISEVHQLKSKINNPAKVIADGGTKKYADIIKALALGADFVMIGGLFNKALESASPCLEIPDNESPILSYEDAKKRFDADLPVYKKFRGMSTKSVQVELGSSKPKTSEGTTSFRQVEYTLSGWVENFEHYLKSAMSYTDKTNIKDFIGKVDYNLITQNAFKRYNK